MENATVQRVGQPNRCAYCGGNIIVGEDHPACLQCSRSVRPPRPPTAEERKPKRGQKMRR